MKEHQKGISIIHEPGYSSLKNYLWTISKNNHDFQVVFLKNH